jgi:hypothetical protein
MAVFNATQLQGLKTSLGKVDKLNKAKGTADAIAMAGEIAGQIITVVYAVRNEKERKRIAESLQELDERQMAQLGESLNRINTINAQIEFITNYVANLVGGKESERLSSNIKNKYLGGVMSERKKVLIGVGVTLALFIAIIVIKKIRK